LNTLDLAIKTVVCIGRCRGWGFALHFEKKSAKALVKGKTKGHVSSYLPAVTILCA
jgi:hypothetical protein